MNIYEENGYKNRDEYLDFMAQDYGIGSDIVQALADILGPEEDFDGLIIAIESALDDEF